MRYAHTNIVAADWRRLVQFYCDVFSCVPAPPERNQSGEWLARGTGIPHAEIQGMHLFLPGYDQKGPTLEIYQYQQIEPNLPSVPNRKGLGHLAFTVDDIRHTRDQVLLHGGRAVGEISEANVDGVGKLSFVYMADPEGNLIEIQHWD